MLTKTVEIVPIDTMIDMITTLVNKVKISSNAADANDWCRNVELVAIGTYKSLVERGVIDPRDVGWSIELGFYNNVLESVNKIRRLLYDVNSIIEKYDQQTAEIRYPVNPILKAIHDTLLSILHNQKVLTSATITFTIPNLILHAEGVVNSW